MLFTACNNKNEKSQEDPEEVSVENLEKVEIKVTGMTCGNCEDKVQKEVTSLGGIQSVEASHETENAVIEYDKSRTDIEAIKNAIAESGFEAHDHTIIESPTVE